MSFEHSESNLYPNTSEIGQGGNFQNIDSQNNTSHCFSDQQSNSPNSIGHICGFSDHTDPTRDSQHLESQFCTYLADQSGESQHSFIVNSTEVGYDNPVIQGDSQEAGSDLLDTHVDVCFPSCLNSNAVLADFNDAYQCESPDVYIDDSEDQNFSDTKFCQDLSEQNDHQFTTIGWPPIEINDYDMKNSVEDTHLNSGDNFAVYSGIHANDNDKTHVDAMKLNDMRIKENTNNSVAKQPMEHNQIDTDEVPSAIMDNLNGTQAEMDVHTHCIENSLTVTDDFPKNSGLASSERTLSNCRHESSSSNTDQPTCNVAHPSDLQVSNNEFNVNYPEYRLFNSCNDGMVAEHLLHDQSKDQVNMAFISDTIPTERSPDAETWSSSQDYSLLHYPLPGFQGLGQAEGLHHAVATDDQIPAPSHVPLVGMTPPPYDGTPTSTDPSGWFTPPQSPPPSIAAVHASNAESTLPSGSLCVNGTIHGKSTPILVDTGASISAVSNAFYHTLSPVPKIKPSDLPFIRTVSGEQLPVLGTATLTFVLDTIPYSFSISVIDQLNYPVVLGRDFLMHFNSVIDMQNYTLSLSGNQPISLGPDHFLNSLHHSTGSEPVTVHAFATYILPPLSESIIPVYAKVSLPVGSTGLIEPSPRLAERYQICGAAQLVC